MPNFNRENLKSLTHTEGDFFLSHKFGLEIDGVTVNGVNKLEGLEFEAEVVEWCNGDDPQTHCRPGQLRGGRIIVERDHGNDKSFFEWRKKVMEGKTDRRSMSITFHNDASEEAHRINIFNCFPVKWHGPTLNSESSGHASERVEIVFEEIKVEKK